MLYTLSTKYHLQSAKQAPYQKHDLLTKNTEEFSGGNGHKNGLVEAEREREGEGEKTRHKEPWE